MGKGEGRSIGRIDLLTAAELQSGLDLTLFTKTHTLSNMLVTHGLFVGRFALTVTTLPIFHNQNPRFALWIPTALAIKVSLHRHKKFRFMKTNTQHSSPSHIAIFNTDESFSI